MPTDDPLQFTLSLSDWLQDASSVAGPAAESLASQILGLLENARVPLSIDLSLPLPTTATPLEAPPGEPTAVLRQLVASLVASEAKLRPHHLSLAGATIATDMNVSVDERPVARAQIHLTLAPAAAP